MLALYLIFIAFSIPCIQDERGIAREDKSWKDRGSRALTAKWTFIDIIVGPMNHLGIMA
jgi:hypothetical protein